MASIVSRKGKGGHVSFLVRVRVKGHAPQAETFRRKTDAVNWARSTEASLREGRYGATAESKRHTVADLIDRYLAEVLPQKRPEKPAQTA
jgi:hypothetical protein